MPKTISVGQTSQAVYQEWSGLNGTGVVLPNAGPIAYSSSNPAVATVDANGLATGVSAGDAVITGSDATNGLSASDTLTVTALVAQSATLVLQ